MQDEIVDEDDAWHYDRQEEAASPASQAKEESKSGRSPSSKPGSRKPRETTKKAGRSSRRTPCAPCMCMRVCMLSCVWHGHGMCTQVAVKSAHVFDATAHLKKIAPSIAGGGAAAPEVTIDLSV